MSVGVKPIANYGGKQVFRLAFSFMGVQCREYIPLPHTKANETYCVRLRAEIQGKIAKGEFRYTDYFPNSPRASIFGHAKPRTGLIGDALKAYLLRVKGTFAPSTYAATRKAVNNVLIPWCGKMRLSDFKPSDLRDWVGLQTTTLKRIRNVLLPLRAVFDEAVSDEVIPSNPFDKVNIAKLVPESRRTSTFDPNPYTEADLFKVLATLPPLERWTFQLWAYAGLRTGELIGLRWGNVDFEVGTIKIVETTTERQDKPQPKTKAGIRTIKLLPAALEAVEGLRAHTLLGGDRVTRNPRSTRTDRAWDDKRLAGIWKAAHKDTGVAYRNPYQLRHTFASNLLSQGENPAHIAKLLGHKTVEMVIRNYGRWVDQGEQLGMDRPPRRYGMERLFTGLIVVDAREK